MKRRRLRQPRLLRRDWIGDAVLVIVCGVLLLVSLWLPWVNVDGHGWVNFSLQQGQDLFGVLETRWGTPAAVVGLVVLAAGLVMLFTRPRRWSALLGVLVAVAGFAAFAVAQDAAAHAGFYDPGMGMYLTTLVGVLLVPIGLAASVVALILVRAERAGEEPPAPGAPPTVTPDGAPPAPPSLESAPPS
jgi:hypothetical protein